MKYFLLIFLVLLMSCKKEWLDEKPDLKISLLSDAAGCQALLDNEFMYDLDPGYKEASTDDIYVPGATLASLGAVDGSVYTWAKDLFVTGDLVDVADWTNQYKKVYSANLVLESLPKITVFATPEQKNNLIGQALFHRANAFYQIASLFSRAFDNSSLTSPGVILRLTTDFNEKTPRSTVKDSYNRITEDLKNSISLLPKQSVTKTGLRPTKGAVYGLLSRIYLAMADYDNALIYADSAIQMNSLLLDFNTISKMRYVSEEILMYTGLNGNGILSAAAVDSVLFRSYSSNDLRKTLFFTVNSSGIANYFNGAGSYAGAFGRRFSGIANDELYLNRAECYARKSDIAKAMNDLNALCVKRYKTGTFSPYTVTTTAQALDLILKERRKELVYRGVRWTDLRRLNKEPQYAITLNRLVNGVTYSLPPNDNRYVFPIPPNEILLSGVEQNPR